MKDYHKQMKEVVAPSEGVLESYKKLFKRNQTKWMRRSKLEIDHLDKEFEFDGVSYILEGSIDSTMMIIRDMNLLIDTQGRNNNFGFICCDDTSTNCCDC